MYKKKTCDLDNSPIIKGHETFAEMSLLLILEEQFHDAELIELFIENNDDIKIALLHEGVYFSILCRDVVSKNIHFDIANKILYEINLEKENDLFVLLIDDAGIKIKAKEMAIEEVVKYERINYSNEEIEAIDLKSNNPDVYVRCPRCGKELHYRAVGNSYEIRCYTEGCIKAIFRGI